MSTVPTQTTRPSRSVLLYRIVTGHHLDGIHRTDATWFRRGTVVVHHSGRASRWAHLSRAERTGWRLGTAAVFIGVIYGYLIHPLTTTICLAIIVAGGITYGAWCLYRAIVSWRHRRYWVRPLHVALCRVLGVSLKTQMESYLTVPVDIASNDDAEVRVNLPEGFVGDKTMRQTIETVISEKLGIRNTVAHWRVAGHEPYMTVRVAARPPEKAVWKDNLGAIEKAPESAPLIGLTVGSKTVSIDADAEAPHILISASTGGGKSTIIRTLTSQFMHHGAIVVCLDIKRHSHNWMRGLEGVIYCRDAEDIHDILIKIAEEGDRRNRLVEQHGDNIVGDFPRIVLIAEEMNGTINRLQNYWVTVRDKDDPKKSPAIDAFGETLFMGRATKLNVIAVGQMMSARALGGPEMRECFGARILSRYTVNNWRMLVPEVSMPRSSRHPGRVQVCIAGQATETQSLFPSDAEAREWATSGVQSPAGFTTSVLRSELEVSHQGESTVAVVPRPRTNLVLVPAGASAPEPQKELPGLTLSEAVTEGVLTLSLNTARKAAWRDPEFPKPITTRKSAHVYAREDLERWQRNRPKAIAG